MEDNKEKELKHVQLLENFDADGYESSMGESSLDMEEEEADFVVSDSEEEAPLEEDHADLDHTDPSMVAKWSNKFFDGFKSEKYDNLDDAEKKKVSDKLANVFKAIDGLELALVACKCISTQRKDEE
jgi:hypothetical protein